MIEIRHTSCEPDIFRNLTNRSQLRDILKTKIIKRSLIVKIIISGWEERPATDMRAVMETGHALPWDSCEARSLPCKCQQHMTRHMQLNSWPQEHSSPPIHIPQMTSKTKQLCVCAAKRSNSLSNAPRCPVTLKRSFDKIWVSELRRSGPSRGELGRG